VIVVFEYFGILRIAECDDCFGANSYRPSNVYRFELTVRRLERACGQARERASCELAQDETSQSTGGRTGVAQLELVLDRGRSMPLAKAGIGSVAQMVKPPANALDSESFVRYPASPKFAQGSSICPVSRRVGNVKNNDASLMEPIAA
jgi:hypothetical protein